MKNINVEDRLIFALDVPEIDQAKNLVAELDDSVNFYKIGMEMLMTGSYFELLNWLTERDKKVLLLVLSNSASGIISGFNFLPKIL